MDQNFGKKIVKGISWQFAERILASAVTFVVSVFLSRILDPSDYGVIAILMVFIAIADVFVTSSFSTALIQKKDADETDFSSVFWFCLFFSIFVYGVLFLAAPFISNFYNQPILTSLLRILGVKVIISSLNSVQRVYVQKKMMFRKFFFSTLIGTVISAGVGLYMAKKGYGPYALAGQTLTNAVIDTIVLWLTIDWHPAPLFDKSRLKPLLDFGSKMLAAALLDTVYQNLRTLIIGKKYTTEDLAYYNKGRNLPELLTTNINSSAGTVLMSAMSSIQDDELQLKNTLRRSIRMFCMIIMPMMFGLLATSRNVILLYGEKWLPALPYMIIACLMFSLEAIQVINLQAIKSKGRSDIVLILEVIKKGYGIAILLITMRMGVYYIALGGLSQAIVALLCNTYPNVKLVNYRYSEQFKDILPPLFCSLIMCAAVYFVGGFFTNNYVALFVKVVTGVGLYVGISYFIQKENFNEVLALLKKFTNR